MRYHITPVRTAFIKKSTNHKCWRGGGGKGTLVIVGGNVNWYKSDRKVIHKELPEEIRGPSSPSAPDLCKPQLTGPNALPGVD